MAATVMKRELEFSEGKISDNFAPETFLSFNSFDIYFCFSFI